METRDSKEEYIANLIQRDGVRLSYSEILMQGILLAVFWWIGAMVWMIPQVIAEEFAGQGSSVARVTNVIAALAGLFVAVGATKLVVVDLARNMTKDTYSRVIFGWEWKCREAEKPKPEVFYS